MVPLEEPAEAEVESVSCQAVVVVLAGRETAVAAIKQAAAVVPLYSKVALVTAQLISSMLHRGQLAIIMEALAVAAVAVIKVVVAVVAIQVAVVAQKILLTTTVSAELLWVRAAGVAVRFSTRRPLMQLRLTGSRPLTTLEMDMWRLWRLAQLRNPPGSHWLVWVAWFQLWRSVVGGSNLSFQLKILAKFRRTSKQHPDATLKETANRVWHQPHAVWLRLLGQRGFTLENS
jgi:hypothetical protein